MRNTSPLIAMGFFMSGLLMLCAIACVILPAAESWLKGPNKYIMAVVLAAYATFRFIRTRRLWLQSKNNNPE